MVLKIDIPQLEKAIEKQDTEDTLVTQVLADIQAAIQLGNKIAKDIEDNWEYFSIEKDINNAEFMIFSINFITNYIETKLLGETISNKALAEATKEFYGTLRNLRKILIETREYEIVASEVSEILKYPRTSEKENRIKKIIECGKEGAKTLPPLSKRQIQERLDGTWDAMLSEVEQSYS